MTVAPSPDGAPPATAHDRIWSAVERLDLRDNVAELDALGLTVVPPERMLAPDRLDHVFATVLDLMERRNGVRPDVELGSTHVNISFPTLYFFLLEDPVFVEVLLHPVARALVDYLVGERCVLHATTVFMKGPADPPGPGLQLGLHSDQQMVPEPFPTYPLIVGATLLLTDYTRAKGAFAYVPGSHRHARHPLGREGCDQVVPVEAPRGSLLVHHGALWHGSFPRTEPGLRAGMAYAYSRMFMTPLEGYRERVTDEQLAAAPPRLAGLLGRGVPTGSTEGGPDLGLVATAIARTPWD